MSSRSGTGTMRPCRSRRTVHDRIHASAASDTAKRIDATGVRMVISHIGCGDTNSMRLVRQQNLEQRTVELPRYTIERVEALAKQHAVSPGEILGALIANALAVEDDLARHYDELSPMLDQRHAHMSAEAQTVLSRAMNSVIELEEYALARTLGTTALRG